MKQKTNIENTKKRESLKKLRNAGIGSAVATSSLAAGWVKPVVDAVVLPAHALTTQGCPVPRVVAVLGRCSGDGPLEVTIDSPTGCPIEIVSTPTLTVQPTPNDWGLDANAPPPPAVPAEISDTVSYVINYAGSVLSQETCYPPTTDVPNGNPQIVTSMVVSFSWKSLTNDVTETMTIDVLSQLVAP